VSEIDREDVVAIMTSMMALHAKVDRILGYLEGDDGEEAGEA
jgi:hypothetical protein